MRAELQENDPSTRSIYPDQAIPPQVHCRTSPDAPWLARISGSTELVSFTMLSFDNPEVHLQKWNPVEMTPQIISHLTMLDSLLPPE